MKIKEFAERHGVRIQKDSCGDPIITGWRYSDAPRRKECALHIYDGFAGGRLGLCLTGQDAREWRATKKMLMAAGFQLLQDGDAEGCLSFNSEDDEQSRLALNTACILPVTEKAA